MLKKLFQTIALLFLTLQVPLFSWWDAAFGEADLGRVATMTAEERKIAEKRLALAGYHLAELLNNL